MNDICVCSMIGFSIITDHLKFYREHKKRLGVNSGSEEDPTHSGKYCTPLRYIRSNKFCSENLLVNSFVLGEEDNVSFIDLQHNNFKLPEKKGILKKQGYGLIMGSDSKESWCDGQSDEIMTSEVDQIIRNSSMTDVESTLKSLNGYHADIMKALRMAANHRGTTTPSGSSSALCEEVLRRSLQECVTNYPDYKRTSSQEKVSFLFFTRSLYTFSCDT